MMKEFLPLSVTAHRFSGHSSPQPGDYTAWAKRLISCYIINLNIVTISGLNDQNNK